MSAESVAAEIRQNILPKCYKDLLEERDDVSDLPSYYELLGVLDLKEGMSFHCLELALATAFVTTDMVLSKRMLWTILRNGF
jgi:hypothetical protein